MYRNTDRYIYIINTILVILILSSFISTKYIEIDTETIVVKNDSLVTYLKSNYIEQLVEEPIKEEIKEIEKVEETKIETSIKKEEKQPEIKQEKKSEVKKNETSKSKKEEVKKEESQQKQKEEIKKEEVKEENQSNKNSDVKVLETLTGSLAGYGPDCYGCTSFRTASGRYIGDGKIYYEDKEYGKIRIVAGDKSYPFGTIVRIKNTKYGDNSDIYAIVLDRGGGVGKGKKFLFDLLFETESAAAKAGSRKNVTFEILRLGY